MAEKHNGGANPPPPHLSIIESNFDFVRHFKKGEWGADLLELHPRHESWPFDAILCSTDEYEGRYECRPRDTKPRDATLKGRTCDLLPNIDRLILYGNNWTGTVWIRFR